jgi:opacity protein-like surface antigen
MNPLIFRKTADGSPDGSSDILAISGRSRIRGIFRILTLICLVSLSGARLLAQALPTASANGELQIGAMFNLGNSDYRPQKFKGYGFYATFDFRQHIGIEGEFHQLNDPNATDGVYERTYEIGPRYVLHHGRYNPYIKGMFGRGVFNYPLLPVTPGSSTLEQTANLAYNIGAIGAGVDYRVVPGMNVRGEYEYQRWLSFPPNGLSPWILSIGAAYRFH